MVPLRMDVCEDRPRWVEARPRPQLVLEDVTQERMPGRAAKPSSVKRSFMSRIESVLLAASLAAVLLFFLVNFALSLFHSVQQSYSPSAIPSVMMISKTVARGDTLTKFARRYLSPDTYTPDGIEQILRANPKLSGTTPLVPGQHLQIPVSNPTVIAQILKNQHHAVLAAR